MDAREAVFRFAAWLSARPGTLKVGEKHDVAFLVNLLDEWCSINGITDPTVRSIPMYEYQCLQTASLAPPEQLTELSRDGWRLLTIVPMGEMYYFYFERKVVM